MHIKNKKKRVKGVLSNLVEGGHGFLNFLRGGHLQKNLGNPDPDALFIINANELALTCLFIKLYVNELAYHFRKLLKIT